MNTEIHEKVIKEFLFTALSIFIFKVKFGFSKDEYFQLKEYYYESSNKSQVKNEQKEEQINYLYRYGNDAYESIVLSFLEHETYDKTHLQEILKHNSQYIKFLDKKDGLMYSWKRLHSDFSYNIDDFLQESLPTLFSDTIEKVLNLGDFHFFIEFVKKHQSVDSMKVDEIIKRYIDDLILREKSISIHESQNFEIIDNHYPYLKKYADNKKHEILIEVAQDELIAQTLKKCLKGWGEKDQYILNNSEVSKYKEMILNNPEFIEDVVYFLKKGVNDQYFSQAIINIQQALSELANENENYRFKVEKILKK